MKIENGKKVRIEYSLTMDGEVVESSEQQGPLEYKHGENALPLGLEGELTGLAVGAEKSGNLSIDLPTFDMKKAEFPADFKVEKGVHFMGKREGQDVELQVVSLDGDKVKVQPVHPLAGKTLAYKVKILDIT